MTWGKNWYKKLKKVQKCIYVIVSNIFVMLRLRITRLVISFRLIELSFRNKL